MEKTRMFTFAGRVIKNLFQKPATTQYPFEPVELLNKLLMENYHKKIF